MSCDLLILAKVVANSRSKPPKARELKIEIAITVIDSLTTVFLSGQLICLICWPTSFKNWNGFIRVLYFGVVFSTSCYWYFEISINI